MARKKQRKTTILLTALFAVMFVGIVIGTWRTVREQGTYIYHNRGPAMAPTYANGDEVKGVIRQSQDVSRGDIIIFKPPSTSTERMIKRVVGLPGDTVVVKDGRISVTTSDGELYDPGLSGAPPLQELTRTVSAESFFVVGDNLSNSLDSRAEGFGLVPFENLISVAIK